MATGSCINAVNAAWFCWINGIISGFSWHGRCVGRPSRTHGDGSEGIYSGWDIRAIRLTSLIPLAETVARCALRELCATCCMTYVVACREADCNVRAVSRGPLTATTISFRAEGTKGQRRAAGRKAGGRRSATGAWANPVISCGSSSGRCCTMCRHIENIATARSACPWQAHTTVPNMQRTVSPHATETRLPLTTGNDRGRTGRLPLPLSRCARPLMPAAVLRANACAAHR